MINVLIVGAGSYIGSHIAAWLPKKQYCVRELDVRTGLDETAFANQDAVIHVAGIAHQKETPENAPLYHKVNCELAVASAKAAKANGVKQFVFFSSMSVYGMTTGHITAETAPAPTRIMAAASGTRNSRWRILRMTISRSPRCARP